jgi:hypothetical protein
MFWRGLSHPSPPSIEDALKTIYCAVKILGDIKHFFPPPRNLEGFVPCSPVVFAQVDYRGATFADIG